MSASHVAPNPTVSIITPNLNGGAYLAEAIASVQAQTYTDWELLVADDGSIDNSLEVTARAASLDQRIKLIKPDPLRRGAAAARNRALNASRGKYIVFLDADDLFETTKLATEVAKFELMPEVGWIYGPTRFWWPADGRAWTQDMRRQAGRTYQPPGLLGSVLLEQLGEVSCVCAVMIRREAVEAVGGFEEGFEIYEDQCLWVKLMLRYPVHVIGEVHSRYRQHPDSACAAATAAGDFDRLGGPHASRRAFLSWAAEYTRAAGKLTPQLEGAFRRAFRDYEDPAWTMRSSDRLILAVRRLRRALRPLRRALSRVASRRSTLV